MQADEKSDVLSHKFREEGNVHYRNKNYYKALKLYNKSIGYADSKKNIALGLANRSAVFLELQKYKSCLDDIDVARDYDYPANKLKKLNEREEKCKKLMEENPKNPLDPIIRFFMPTYNLNWRIPFINNRLEMRPLRFGGGIFATKDIKAGAILTFAEQPAFVVLAANKEYYHRCFICGVARFELVIHPFRTDRMFCSSECFVKYEEYRTDPRCDIVYTNFGGFDQMMRFFDKFNINTIDKTVFDFNLSDEDHPYYKENLMRCALSLNRRFVPSKMTMESQPEFVKSDQRLCDFIKVLSNLVLNSSYILKGVEFVNGVKKSCNEGFLIYPFYNLINHSCIPNVANVVAVKNFSFLYATQPIKAGEELFYDYVPKRKFNSPEDVKEFLLEYRNYKCECYYCTNNASLEDLPMGYNDDIQQALIKSMMLNFTVQNSSQIVRQLRENFKIIRDHTDDALTRHVQILKMENHRIIKLMGELWCYSCIRDD